MAICVASLLAGCRQVQQFSEAALGFCPLLGSKFNVRSHFIGGPVSRMIIGNLCT